MFQGGRRITKCTRLAILIALSVAGFAAYGLYSLNTLKETRVYGPSFERLVQGKDLVADVLPPPACLVEGYLTAYQMVNDRSGLELPALIQRFERLRVEYRDRHDFWLKDLPDGELKRVFLDKSYVPGLRLLETVETGLIPALLAGDRARAQALLEGPIREDYEEHRAHIDDVVELAEARYQDESAAADGVVSKRTRGLVLAGLFSTVLLSVAGWVVVRALSETLSGDGSAESRDPYCKELA